MEIFNPELGKMAKSDRGQDLVSLVRGVGNTALLLLVITVGALVPIKAIELVSGRPILDEFVDFAKEPSLGIKSRRENNP